ncbi:hypothetical protein GQ43DRAFT_304166 [Delitschia confertaspora ATCC 74209]|uniref:Uncharacterized protein n=1 Tax=Delitschia confertaspora ATCC 74209 TaxID=1513339 RepID=A0A9P4N093_9PLEO|nr:hypothetical protein GQ43DRAFT_304166 [Delitschia confertaspora ATCC 74209]
MADVQFRQTGHSRLFHGGPRSRFRSLPPSNPSMTSPLFPSLSSAFSFLVTRILGWRFSLFQRRLSLYLSLPLLFLSLSLPYLSWTLTSV